MPLSWFWQVICTYSPLIKHASSSHSKCGYSFTISQDLLDGGLTNFSAYNSLAKKEKKEKEKAWMDVQVKNQK